MVLDLYVFTAGRGLIDTVIAGGIDVVSDGRHRSREAIARRYRQVVSRLSNA